MSLYNPANNCQKITVKIAVFLLFLLVFSFFPPAYSSASVMESDNYKLESDEINMGAIGDMRDFSTYNERGTPVASERASSAGFAGILLFLFFAFYILYKNRTKIILRKNE